MNQLNLIEHRQIIRDLYELRYPGKEIREADLLMYMNSPAGALRDAVEKIIRLEASFEELTVDVARVGAMQDQFDAAVKTFTKQIDEIVETE